jgi:cell division topological specificity factor
MRLFGFLKPISSAPVARERLQILLEYERRMVSQSSLITILKDEILAVVSRHVSIDPEKIQVSVDSGDGFSTLAVGVQIPNQPGAAGIPTLAEPHPEWPEPGRPHRA